MDIFKSLGIDSTLWIHLVCFLVSFTAFTQLILKPYTAALKERERRTLGNEETAARVIEEANDLHHEYEKKARDVNGQVKSLYDQSRAAAMKEYDQIVTSTRDEATKIVEKSRAQIAQEVQGARKVLSAEVPAVSSAIASKLAGKEISL